MRYLFLLLLLAPMVGLATTIKCSNIEYANKDLQFFQLSDPISGERELAFSLKFDASGVATAGIGNSTSLYVFSDFGVYRGMLLLLPGKTINLKFPPLREKSFGDEKNPYFRPVTFWFQTLNSKNLNDKISKFDQELNALTNKYFDELYFNQSKTVYDSLIYILNESFTEKPSQAFMHHKALQLQFIKADVFRQRPEAFSEIFEGIGSEYWTHQAFVALFDKTFNNQLSFSAKAIGGQDIFAAVQNEDSKNLLTFVKKKYKVSGHMADLVLLKLLHDGFYSGDFSQTAIKKMVLSPMFSNHANPVIKKAAQNINYKFTFLQVGSEAPAICLKDFEGLQHCSDSGQEKFKYIVFADTETIVCQEHLKYLSRINELFQKHLAIFIVLRDTDKQAIKTFFAENKIPGIKTIDTGNKQIMHYKVRSFPTCYLLNEKHAVQFSNTKAPLDGFEQQFGTFLRNELFIRQRNQYQNK